MTDAYCLRIRRQAVLAYYGWHCFFCPQDFGLEDHHIVRRAVLILRWDWRDGIPVCHDHHVYAASKKGRKEILERIEFSEYLDERKNIPLTDWCVKHGTTQDEFMKQMVSESLDVIEKCMRSRV